MRPSLRPLSPPGAYSLAPALAVASPVGARAAGAPETAGAGAAVGGTAAGAAVGDTILGVVGIRSRPDLIDRCTHEIWEIKQWDDEYAAESDLIYYLAILDGQGETDYRPGESYTFCTGSRAATLALKCPTRSPSRPSTWYPR